MFIALPTLTCMTVFHVELQFDISYCCQPHLVGQSQHNNQKSDLIMMMVDSNAEEDAIY